MAMDLTDRKQQASINIMVGMITLLTAVVGLIAWYENKKHNRINDEVLKLDKEIKTLELAMKKQEAVKNGISV